MIDIDDRAEALLCEFDLQSLDTRERDLARQAIKKALAPLELLAFIESGSSMTSEKMHAKWPEWMKLYEAASARFDRECAAYRAKWQTRRDGTTDVMVNSRDAALRYWVFLPLIRAALAQETSNAK